MKRVTTLMMSFIIVIFTFMMGGWGKSDSGISRKETPYAITSEKNAEGQRVAETYLTEQYREVIKVKETVEGYTKAYTTVDYKVTDGMGHFRQLLMK